MRRFRALEPQKRIPYYEIAPPKGCLSLKHWETVMTKSREARLQDAKKQRDSLRVETDQARVMIERLQAEVTELRRSADDMMMQSHARSEGAGGLSAPSPLSPTAKVSVSHSSPPTHHISLSPLVPPLALAAQVRAAEQMSSSDVEALVAAALKELRADPNHNAKAGDRVYGKSTEFKLMMATIPTLAPQLSHRQIMQLVPLIIYFTVKELLRQELDPENLKHIIALTPGFDQMSTIIEEAGFLDDHATHVKMDKLGMTALFFILDDGNKKDLNSDGHWHHEEPREWDPSPSGLLTLPLVASYILAHTPPPS